MKTLVAFIYVVFTLYSLTAVAKLSTLDESLKMKALSQQIDMLGQEGEFSGSILFARNGQVLFHKVIGQLHPRSNKRITKSSAFNLGSLSKQFIAMAIMILRYQGKLDYDKPIYSYLPNFPYSQVTVRHLLTHTSGMVGYEKLMNKSSSKQVLTNKNIMSQFFKHSPNLKFSPGSRYYDNPIDYVVLAYIVETLSEQPLDEFAKQYIFEPLNMHNTHIFTSVSQNYELKNSVYGQPDDKLNGHPKTVGVIGAGAVYSTAVDLFKWHQGLSSNKLVPPSLLVDAFSPAILTDGSIKYYGFGWVIDRSNPKIVSHSSHQHGNYAFIIRNMKTDELLIFMTNNTKGIEFSKLKTLIYSGFETQFSNIY
ncbi:serine hydrolase domain-containing protein [Pseudoalteromonas umbrosa]|uniref:serine hydrolase domain-containing protein n=1 Tax=Pseudoalteromonas umbrosa TaxID=3048489 RepID=UPI0024C3097B|nr:serine hydrolase domain-containing protein [Pseudoalteromonas sp. B95]MDK1286788.1 serine hydrolase domain-containing protein [Pseudoalteromonas sp. B95]